MNYRNTVTLEASSDYTTKGKQFIGLVTGPDRKWGTALEFVGSGSQGSTTATVVEPGLYKIRSTTRKGTDDSYTLVWGLDDALMTTAVSGGDALRIAKDLSPEALASAGRRIEAADLAKIIEGGYAKPQDETITVDRQLATELGLEPGAHPRSALLAARVSLLERIRAVDAPAPAPKRRPRAKPALSARAELVARRAELEREIAALDQAIAALDAAR